MLIDAKCKSCELILEILVKRSEILQNGDISSEHVCPDCGAQLQKSVAITSGSFQLKGRGWARDNYS